MIGFVDTRLGISYYLVLVLQATAVFVCNIREIDIVTLGKVEVQVFLLHKRRREGSDEIRKRCSFAAGCYQDRRGTLPRWPFARSLVVSRESPMLISLHLIFLVFLIEL